MMQQNGFEGQERIFRVAVTLPDINMFELKVLTHYPERPYLIPLLRERDDDVQLVYSLQSHLTLEQWLRRTAVDYHDLLSILEEIVNVLDHAAKHCLRLDHFCMTPSQICYHTLRKRIELIYMPTRSAEFAFEHQWQQLLSSLTSVAAMSLKPEGHELFKSLTDFTVHRHERQSALLNVIRHWFASESNSLVFDQTDRDVLSSSTSQPASSMNAETEASCLPVVSRSKQITKASDGGKTFLIPNQKVRNSRYDIIELIRYFKRLYKRNSKVLMYESAGSNSEMGHEIKDKNHPDTSVQRKIALYRPEFEGTTLLSEQEILQGKLVLQNQQACKIFELTKPITRIGRNAALCDVIIDGDITIGRLHAEVHRLDQGYFVKDLDSLNGTYLNEQRLDSQTLYKLKGSDLLRLSEQEILFV